VTLALVLVTEPAALLTTTEYEFPLINEVTDAMV